MACEKARKEPEKSTRETGLKEEETGERRRKKRKRKKKKKKWLFLLVEDCAKMLRRGRRGEGRMNDFARTREKRKTKDFSE